MSTIGPPTPAGFLAWVRAAMQITPAQLPDSSIFLTYAFNVAVDIVNLALAQASPDIYTLAVYNLGGSNLVNYAPDPPGAPPVPGSNPPLPFFAKLRATYGTADFVAGVVQASGDQGTNNSLLVQDALKTITLADLQLLKDPWGRTYLQFAQKFGTLWGLT